MVRFLLERKTILLALDSIPSYSFCSISRDCGAIRQCVLGDIFSPGLSLSSEGVGCSGGSVWLEQGKREENKRRWCLQNKLRRKRSFMIKLIVSTYLYLRRIIFSNIVHSLPVHHQRKKEMAKRQKERKGKNRLTSQTSFQSSPNANSSSSSASCPCLS